MDITTVLDFINDTRLIKCALENIKKRTASENLIQATRENATDILKQIKFIELGVYGEEYSDTQALDNVRFLINEFFYLSSTYDTM